MESRGGLEEAGSPREARARAPDLLPFTAFSGELWLYYPKGRSGERMGWKCPPKTHLWFSRLSLYSCSAPSPCLSTYCSFFQCERISGDRLGPEKVSYTYDLTL